MLYAILFMFATADHPAQMQVLSAETWPTMTACEAVLDEQGTKFALYMDAQHIQMVGATGECVVDPRGGRGV